MLETWAFDQDHFKDAITLLYLNDKRETSLIDLELKKLINLQFENNNDRNIWVVNLFDKVSRRLAGMRLQILTSVLRGQFLSDRTISKSRAFWSIFGLLKLRETLLVDLHFKLKN